ncbi:MAG: hypothetical protein KDD42_03150, partial [Bdellovibrionales bacterium]|nr:hypothetical protein [Bdellovibrionales bacterium]
MRQPRWLKHKDSVSAVLISCAALLLSALSYSQIVQIEEGSSRAIASIQMGSTHFGLFSSNRCIGTLLMDLRMEDVLF